MRERALARRYARGFVQAALSKARPEEVLCEMDALAAAALRVPSLVRGLSDEMVPIERRLAAAEAVAEALGLCSEASGALAMLIKKRRARLLPLFCGISRDLIEERQKGARAVLRAPSAKAAESIRGRVEEILSKASGREVRCDVEVAPETIGGFEVMMGDVRFDASISGELERMKKSLYSREREL